MGTVSRSPMVPARLRTTSSAMASEAWSVDAFMLLGLAAKWGERGDEAIRWFKQADYTHPQCWPAHYHLADLYRGRDAAGPACRSYRVVP